MTKAELIEALKDFPDDMEVKVKGWGDMLKDVSLDLNEFEQDYDDIPRAYILLEN